MSKTGVVFVTATWARTLEEKQAIIKGITLLNSFACPIIIGDKLTTTYPLIDDLRALPYVKIVQSDNFNKQRRGAFFEATKLGETLFWLESDKEEFIRNYVERILKDHSLYKGNIVFPFPDQESFSSCPSFQQLIENCINSLIKAYIPEGGHFTYGPMLLPSHLVHFLKSVQNDFGWGMNAFFAVIAHAKKIPQRSVSLSVNHDPDVQKGENLKRFRLEQLKDYIIALQEASKIMESLSR